MTSNSFHEFHPFQRSQINSIFTCFTNTYTPMRAGAPIKIFRAFKKKGIGLELQGLLVTRLPFSTQSFAYYLRERPRCICMRSIGEILVADVGRKSTDREGGRETGRSEGEQMRTEMDRWMERLKRRERGNIP